MRKVRSQQSEARFLPLATYVLLLACGLSYGDFAFSMAPSSHRPATEQSEILLPAKPRGEEIDIASYFPIRQGDVWTYTWSYRIGSGPIRTVKRTRTFEGRELVNVGFAHKLVSQDGDYLLISLDDQSLRLHGVAEHERGIRYLFDPPVVILSRQMNVGQPIVLTQREEGGLHTRTFTTVFEGLASVETPMGRFPDCLKVKWEMDGSVAREKTTYYFAKGVGIVAYQVDVRNKKTDHDEVSVDARLSLAQLGGRMITRVEDLKLLDVSALTVAAAADNPKARALFRQASESRYVWDKKFPGFEADFTLHRPGELPLSGTIRVDRQLSATVTCSDATARALVHAEVSQFLTHRRMLPFDEVYGPGKAVFSLGEEDPLKGVEVIVNDEEAMGTRYRIRGREIVEISRSYGRVRFVTNHVKNLITDEGRFIAVEYEITYYSNETGEIVGQTSFTERYEKVGAYWLPTGRTKRERAKDKTLTLELSLTNLRYLK